MTARHAGASYLHKLNEQRPFMYRHTLWFFMQVASCTSVMQISLQVN